MDSEQRDLAGDKGAHVKRKLKIRNLIKMAVQNLVLPPVYHLFALGKCDPDLVVFADAHHHKRPENMELLVRELEKRGDGIPADQRTGGPCIRELYLDYQDASFFAVLRHMLSFMRLYARAGTVVLCDNFLPAASCKARPETRVIQLWHACGALKKFGYDTREDIDPSYRGHVFRNTQVVTVSSPFSIAPFASAMRLDKSCILPVGVSRTDRFFDQKWIEMSKKEAFAEHPEWEGKKVVLWAPTFRGNAGDPGLISLNMHALCEALGKEWAAGVCLHPHMKKELSGDDGKLCTRKSADHYFAAADVLIADISQEYSIDAGTFLSKGKNTPFNGWKVKGRPLFTIAGGKLVYHDLSQEGRIR